MRNLPMNTLLRVASGAKSGAEVPEDEVFAGKRSVAVEIANVRTRSSSAPWATPCEPS